MKKTLLFLVMVLSVGQMIAQKGSHWQKVGAQKADGLQRIKTTDYSQNQQLFQVNLTALQQSLANVSARTEGQQGVEVLIPTMSGDLERFLVWENSNFAPELQAQFPEIRAYVGQGVTDRTATLHFSMSPAGIQTMILRADKGSEFIEPFTTDKSVYVLFDSKNRMNGNLPFVCGTEDVALTHEMNTSFLRSDNQSYKTMRLALSCTGEYTAYFGGTAAGALAGMNATMTRVNGVMEKDLALHLNIIAGNTAVIYTNAATDPYSTDDVGTDPANTNNTLGWNVQLQNALTATVGNGAYDIGHLFGAAGGGGNAGCIGCVCVDDTASTTDKNKGSGYTSPGDAIPMGDNFDIDYVVHEMGHQLGANHTFSHTTENNAVNVEPGSGSTIMAYAGITGATDVQAHSDAYYTYRSILQIQTNLATKTCPVSVPIANTPPVMNAGLDYTIPKGTAFVLRGSGTDAQGDAITYCWEQNDDANVPLNATAAAAASYPSGTKTNGPNFRSRMPSTSPNRYMPALATVVSGNLSNAWEATSTVARTLNFTLTGRDNNPTGSQTKTDAMLVTVNATAGPFIVTSQNTDQLVLAPNSTQTVTWNVAGTTANNVNTANVNILLSTDNGLTFSTVLASNTPNDGTQTVTIPNVSQPNCRIMVEAVGNIFYAINGKNIAIGDYEYQAQNVCTDYAFTINAPITESADTSYPGTQFTIADSYTITDFNFNANITHPAIGQVNILIMAPWQTALNTALWYNNTTCTGANMNKWFDTSGAAVNCATTNDGGAFLPYSLANVNAYNGNNSAGAWKIYFKDATVDGNNTAATFNSLTFQLCHSELVPQLAVPNFGLEDFTIYPNPNSGNFNVKFNSYSSNEIKISVHDIQGRRIFNKSYDNNGLFNENLQLNNVQSGIYLVTVQDGNVKEVKRIIVE